MIGEIRRAWALIRPGESRRLKLVAGYGVLIAGLDTVALLLLFVLINLLLNQPVGGLGAALLPHNLRTANDRYSAALFLLVIASILFVARSLLSVLGLWLTTSAVNAAQASLVSQLLVGFARATHLVRLESNSSTTVRNVLFSVERVMSGIVGSSVSLTSDFAIVVAVLLGLALSSPLVAVTVAMYFLALALVWIRVVRGGLARRGRRAQELGEEQIRLILQGISAAKELELRGRREFYADEAVQRTRELYAASRGATVMTGSLRYLLETALIFGAVLIVAVVGVIGGRDAALPAVGLVLAGAFRLLPALNRVLFVINQVQYNGPALDFVEEEVERLAVPDRGSSVLRSSETLPTWGKFRLEDVSFRYPTRSERALRDVSLTILAGESVGIVGPTGSGKSTLLDVILGLLVPDSGRVTIDGVPLGERRTGWQRSIGYVPQDVYLVDDTLRANVALGWRGAEIDDRAVEDAIRFAQLEDVVARLPAGVETPVGERGVRLSGGQRQRVGLARALYVRPSVLVLDEATSNLDTATEQRIVDTLESLYGSLTMIVVTHRVSTVRHSDRILYLERGAVRAEGTFAELTASVPGFSEVEMSARAAGAA